VVICYPFGAEYLRAHRALKELAQRLAAAGFHALRFDYFGTGDSAGAAEEAVLEQWLEDVANAIEEAKAMSGATRLSLVGLRLGATLASLAASPRTDIGKVVLWDPVISGRSHLAELAQRHDALMATRPHPGDFRPGRPDAELLGAPLSTALRVAIEGIELLALPRSPAPGVAVVTSDADPAVDALCRHLQATGAVVHQEHWPGMRVWLEQDDLDRALVPQSALGRIESWLADE
jgi:pimeloyl-ACP methyl ester carboxylesterase